MHDELIHWVREIACDLSFVIVIIRYDKANSQFERKTYVLLRCERDRKYKKIKFDVQLSISNTRKCDCTFKLRGKPIGNGE